MLALIQIINFMLTRLDYTTEEVVESFEAIERGEISFEQLLDICGLEHWTPTFMERAKVKLPKWRSALTAVEFKLGIQ